MLFIIALALHIASSLKVIKYCRRNAYSVNSLTLQIKYAEAWMQLPVSLLQA